MDDQVLSGPALSDFMDPTQENLIPVISEEGKLPELNSLEDLTKWLGLDCSLV
jgi:hypothetical protein